jgi:hypothetical protein
MHAMNGLFSTYHLGDMGCINYRFYSHFCRFNFGKELAVKFPKLFSAYRMSGIQLAAISKLTSVNEQAGTVTLRRRPTASTAVARVKW